LVHKTTKNKKLLFTTILKLRIVHLSRSRHHPLTYNTTHPILFLSTAANPSKQQHAVQQRQHNKGNMAEAVQALLERMVAPLRDLRDRGIFSEVSSDVLFSSTPPALPCCYFAHHLSSKTCSQTADVITGRNPRDSNTSSTIRVFAPKTHGPQIRLPPLY
jgi:hypothetical protein